MQSLRLGCVVMAAGNASRFGENKLTAAVGGKSLITRALEAVPREAFSRVAVVTQYDEIAALASSFGFETVRNSRPDLGASHTVALGVRALADCDALLFEVADQPLLRRETVRAEVEFFRAHPEHIVALSHGGVRGNPCIFPARFYPDLLALTGDRGGSAVLRRYPASLLLFEADARELLDVDTPASLDALTASLD